MKRDRHIEQQMDEALAETFPASDPPFFMAADTTIGAPARAQDVASIAENENRRGRNAELALSLPG